MYEGFQSLVNTKFVEENYEFVYISDLLIPLLAFVKKQAWSKSTYENSSCGWLYNFSDRDKDVIWLPLKTQVIAFNDEDLIKQIETFSKEFKCPCGCDRIGYPKDWYDSLSDYDKTRVYFREEPFWFSQN